MRLHIFSYAFLSAYTFFIIGISLIPLNEPNIGFSFADKITHFLIYITLSFLAVNTFILKKKSSWRIKSLFYSFGIGLIIEFIQIFIPYRRFEWGDIIVNGIGCLLGILIKVS